MGFMPEHDRSRFDAPPPRRSDDRSESPPRPASAFLSPWVQTRSFSASPLIYQRMLAQSDSAARPGNVVYVYDRSGAFCGQALFNPRSQVALRMLTTTETPIDSSFWRGRLERAVELRRQLRLTEVTDAYRLVHAEGDELSGLIIDRFADCLVFELFSLGMFERAAQLAGELAGVLGPPSTLDRPQKTAEAWRVVIRADNRIQQIEGFHCPPSPQDAPRNVVIREHGVRYRVDLTGGHKTGFFCDQRDNRRKLASFCQDASVLDVCCYSGGFALNAKLLGGAREVTALDLDEAALAVAKDNANLNQARIDFVHADAFIFMRQMLTNGRKFDVIVLDPPKFARSREEYDEAIAKYYDLNVLGAQLVRPGGLLLTCSCSGLVSRDAFTDTIFRAVRRTGRAAQVIDFSGAGGDHPIAMNCLETAYLKAAWLRLL